MADSNFTQYETIKHVILLNSHTFYEMSNKGIDSFYKYKKSLPNRISDWSMIWHHALRLHINDLTSGNL